MALVRRHRAIAIAIAVAIAGLPWATAADELAAARTAARGGRFVEAAEQAARAAATLESAGDARRALAARLLEASALDARGRHGEAGAVLESVRGSAPLAAGDGRLHVQFLGALGHHLLARGELERAIPALEEAVARSAELRDARHEATLLHNLATATALRGDVSRAAELERLAADRALAAGDRGLALLALANGVRAATHAGDRDRARTLLGEAVALRDDPPKSHDAAFALVHLARTLERADASGLVDDPDDALRLRSDLLREAADLSREIGDPVVLGHALAERARLYEARGHDAEALALVERALHTVALDTATGAQPLWEAQAGRLLARTGQVDAAIDSYRSAINGLDRDRHAIASGPSRSDSPFRDRVGYVYLEAVDLLLRRASDASDPSARNADLRRAIDTIERLQTAELRDHYQDECVDAALDRRVDLGEISESAALLYPILLPDRIEILVAHRGTIRRVTTRVAADRVTREVEALRRGLTRRAGRRYREPARQLHRWLIDPLEATLQRLAVDTLVFVPGEAFRSIPPASFFDGERFLVERYAVASTPALQLTERGGGDLRSLRVLRGGLSEGQPGFAPLPSVPSELDTIGKLFEGETLLDAEFVETAIRQRLRDGDFDALHLASHAAFAEDPEQTFVLTHDGRLTLSEIADAVGRLERRERPLELLTLSACDTAEGNAESALGLSGVAVKAGARSALGTLWKVNDAAATRLVEKFYAELKEEGATKAQALRRAQIEMIGEPRFRHPIDWAPFLLIGHWR